MRYCLAWVLGMVTARGAALNVAHVALWLGVATLGGCAPDTGSTNGEPPGSGGSTGCVCDDGHSCTIDTCTDDGCRFTVGPNRGETACPAGEYCTLDDGCVSAPACADTAQCEEQWADDACKTNIVCDSAVALCTFDVLDTDGDGHPPEVCGGGDCDDTDADNFLGNAESCDGADNDCDGAVDEDATCPEPMQECRSGACQCRAEYACGDVCVDRLTSVEHCGECGNACAANGSCEAGQCECPDNTVLCSDTYRCADLQADEQDCGECGNTCPLGGECVDGSCECPAGTDLCSDGCVDLSESEAHCGACEAACPGTASCIAGICTCPDDQTVCGPACVDLDSNLFHCGECDNTCPPGTSCVGGVCHCDSGLTLCGTECFDLFNDVSNCGQCGNVCDLGACCAGECADTLTDPLNCGACGLRCPEESTCESGSCVCSPALHIMLDRSWEQGTTATWGPEPAPTAWEVAVDGLLQFVEAPGRSDTRVGLQYFPLELSGDICDVAQYQTPEVPLGPLSTNSSELVASLSSAVVSADAESSKNPALHGALYYAQSWIASQTESRPTAVVLLTRAMPGSACDTVGASGSAAALAAMADLARAAAEPTDEAHRVRTYVVLVGVHPAYDEIDEISTLASAGGTRAAWTIYRAEAALYLAQVLRRIESNVCNPDEPPLSEALLVGYELCFDMSILGCADSTGTCAEDLYPLLFDSPEDCQRAYIDLWECRMNVGACSMDYLLGIDCQAEKTAANAACPDT